MAEDLLDRILRQVRERLRNSRAAHEESQRLQAALAALGDGAAPAAADRLSKRPTRRARQTRAPRGENLRRIHQTVEQRPGATAGEVANATGITRATVSTTLNKLARAGELVKVHLPGGGVGYRHGGDQQEDKTESERPRADQQVDHSRTPRLRPRRTTTD